MGVLGWQGGAYMGRSKDPICGIYKITNTKNDKVYIGQSVDIKARITRHKNFFHPNDYSYNTIKLELNMPIHKAMKKYGEKYFTFDILELCSRECLDERERYWIFYYKSNNRLYGYNVTPGGLGQDFKGGELSFTNKITKEESDIIKKCLKKGMKAIDILEIIPNATFGIIFSIKRGQSWYDEKEIYPLNDRYSDCKFNSDKVIEIRKKFSEGVTIKELADEYQVDYSVISKLVYGKTYSHLPIYERKVKYKRKNVLVRKYSDEEVLFYRKQYWILKRSMLSLYNEMEPKKSNYAAFRNMIKGVTYMDLGGIPLNEL